MTVASLLSKAFIATAVPETLSSLEAWHILWQLPRTVRSRYTKGLNMDGLTGVKEPKEAKKEALQVCLGTTGRFFLFLKTRHGGPQCPC